MNNEQFADMMLQSVHGESFAPQAFYNREGDCIEFITRPDDYYAERIDGLITVYHSRVDDQIIGSVIKGVSTLKNRLAKELPGFLIEIQEGRIQLSHLFLAQSWTSTDPMTVVRYRKLAEIAAETGAQAELTV